MIGSVMQFAAILILLGIDSVIDIKTRKIPNWISGAIALTAFLNFDVRSLWGLIVAVIFFAVALFTGKVGGGDVKLIAALSVVCGLWGSFGKYIEVGGNKNDSRNIYGVIVCKGILGGFVSGSLRVLYAFADTVFHYFGGSYLFP